MKLFDSSKQIKPIERKTFSVLLNYIKKNKCCPTYDDLEQKLGKTRGAIHRHLKSLEKKGYVKLKGGWRSIDIIKMLK
tara:strand:- start:47 stop:280 length:234 start_codon:yes stop_codon:yes gene_type:complete